jgi:hypothetical protein
LQLASPALATTGVHCTQEDKSILILFETSFDKGDENKVSLVYYLLLNEVSKFVFSAYADKSTVTFFNKSLFRGVVNTSLSCFVDCKLLNDVSKIILSTYADKSIVPLFDNPFLMVL